MPADASHNVDVLLFRGVDLLDAVGPAEVFTMANHFASPKQPYYRLRYLAEDIGPLKTNSGPTVIADARLDLTTEPADTLLVPGGIRVEGTEVIPETNPAIVAWLRTHGGAARRLAAVCAGSHLLADAGLLDGHSATTHWATAERLAADHPEVTVTPDPIFLRSGRIWTSAGITAALDLAVALVADDHGEDLAREVARRLVMYVHRPGGQSQFSVPLSVPPSTRSDFAALRRWIGDHLGEDLSVTVLAGRLGVTPRHLTRVFKAEAGTTPGAYVEAVRVERSRWLLERSDRTIAAIARDAGFGSVEAFHRIFRNALGVTPGQYRARFRSASAPPH